MKAIQIRYLPPTNFMPSRLKAWMEGMKPYIKTFQHEISNYEAQVQDVAQEYIYQNALNVEITGIGSLSNEDYVVTIK